MNHIDQDAELYALGMLEEPDALRVREHIEGCAACRELVENARQVVAQLSESVPQREPSRALRERIVRSMRRDRSHSRGGFAFAGGALAGVLAAALVLVPGRVALQNSVSSDDRALSVLVQSHFNHVPFMPLAPGAPQAKVLFGRHGEWLYVVVHDAPRGLQVRLTTAGKPKSIGDLIDDGENAALLVREPGTFHNVELVLDGKIVARAHPVLSAK